MSDQLKHFGVKGMKWGVRRYQPYQKGKKVKGGKEVGKAKSKRQIRKENREAIRKKNNPTGISNRQLVKERVRIAKEEHKKAKDDIETSINKELVDLAKFAKKNGLDPDDGGGGNNEKASREYQSRINDLESRVYDMERIVNKRTAKRLIEEYGDTAVKRINDVNKRKQMAVLAAPLAMSLGAVALTAITQSALDDDDVLQHFGVKGMKWGVRRYQPYPKGQRNAGKFIDAGKTKGSSNQNGSKSNKVNSKKREISMALAQREIKNLSTKDAKKVVSRAQLENRYRQLSKTPNVGNKKARADYLNRENMSNEEIKRKVDRLQIAANMRTEARKANPEVVELGKKAATIAAPFIVSQVFKKVNGSEFTSDILKDIGKQAGEKAAKWVI